MSEKVYEELVTLKNKKKMYEDFVKLLKKNPSYSHISLHKGIDKMPIDEDMFKMLVCYYEEQIHQVDLEISKFTIIKK